MSSRIGAGSGVDSTFLLLALRRSVGVGRADLLLALRRSVGVGRAEAVGKSLQRGFDWSGTIH